MGQKEKARRQAAHQALLREHERNRIKDRRDQHLESCPLCRQAHDETELALEPLQLALETHVDACATCSAAPDGDYEEDGMVLNAGLCPEGHQRELAVTVASRNGYARLCPQGQALIEAVSDVWQEELAEPLVKPDTGKLGVMPLGWLLVISAASPSASPAAGPDSGAPAWIAFIAALGIGSFLGSLAVSGLGYVNGERQRKHEGGQRAAVPVSIKREGGGCPDDPFTVLVEEQPRSGLHEFASCPSKDTGRLVLAVLIRPPHERQPTLGSNGSSWSRRGNQVAIHNWYRNLPMKSEK